MNTLKKKKFHIKIHMRLYDAHTGASHGFLQTSRPPFRSSSRKTVQIHAVLDKFQVKSCAYFKLNSP